MRYRRPRKLLPEQVLEAVELYESGWSCGALGDRYGVTRQSMWDLLRRRTRMRPHFSYGPKSHLWRGGQNDKRARKRARDTLQRAVKRGQIIRPESCERCGGTGKYRDGRTPIHGHHPDYSKPLEVIWLCRRCHFAIESDLCKDKLACTRRRKEGARK